MLPTFDRSRLLIKPLDERKHDITIDQQLALDDVPPPLDQRAMSDIGQLGRRMVRAKERGAAVLLLVGGHVIRAQVARQLIDLMERGLVTHIGMNGAGPIHDYELARVGATCESVARYIRSGEFGLWRETGEMNDIVRDGAAQGMGLGEAIGRHILASDYPHKDLSVLAAGARLGVPVTVHIGIGYDILHEHPNFDPAAFGTASYRDFLAVCATVSNLEGGVFLCLGSAVMGPEVYLKALAMARNVAHQEGRRIANFTTAALDLIKIDGDWQAEATKSNPQYYYRPWKTILVRTVADGGESFYVCGDHRQTVPHLRRAALGEARLAPREAPREATREAARPEPVAENLEAAVAHYQRLKDWVRAHDGPGLEAQARHEKEVCHYATISKDQYLRLFFQAVWVAGFKSQIVAAKEEEYFRVVREVLYPQGRFDARREGEFLVKVASVLGGSSDNRKNKAVFHTFNLVETLGWDEFRRQYVVPQGDQMTRLQELPMMGPKTARMLLNQTGIGEALDEVLIGRFAARHGYSDPDKVLREIAAHTHDAPGVIGFVIRDAGRKKPQLLKA